MSHRKYEHPRCGSLGFLPKKRCRRGKGKIKHFPKDVPSKPCHLTAFLGFKSGMTHIIRDGDNPGSKAYKQEICEPVTIIETPPLCVVGVIGYIKTPRGVRSLNSIFAEHLSEEVRRRFHMNWFAGKKGKAFTKYAKKIADGKKSNEVALEEMKRYCSEIRVLCHTQVRKIPGLGQKKSQLMEIQVCGGSVSDKVAFAYNFMEKTVPVDAVFQINEKIDAISISKGKGTAGVISRWGVTRLPRKTHRGLRKVACIGAWHPSAVKWTVARTGQLGYHHRSELKKKIYRIGKAGEDSFKATTNYDMTDKGITPMGGFHRYGVIKNDYIIVKGSVPGPQRRTITLRQCVFPQATHHIEKESHLKFIDTSSKFGHGRFQTTEEKNSMLGRMKTK